MAKTLPDSAAIVKRELKAAADPGKAALFARFFKAGKGEYAEGDVFMGLSVPHVRGIVNAHTALPLVEIGKLLDDQFHECRLAGVFALVGRFERSDDAGKKEAVDFYLSKLDRVNNWDLVDASAYKILGGYLVNRPRAVLAKLADSGHLWRERVAVVSTFAFIRNGEFADIFRLSEQFLTHRHDLMHKACGWMLREAGKRDKAALERFLKKHGAVMPRTMLRYAIEKFTPSERAVYMALGPSRKRS